MIMNAGKTVIYQVTGRIIARKHFSDSVFKYTCAKSGGRAL